MGSRYPTPAMARSFLGELYRRKVVKVGLVYALVSFAAMEVAGNFFPALHLPDWGETLVAALLILGFPVALALAWAFEVTPTGIRLEVAQPRTGPQDAGSAPPPQAPSAAATVPADGPGSGRASDPGQVWSVAVLPFADLSPGQDQGFFAEGVAEEIRHAMSRVSGLSVVARSSSMAFRDSALDVREIGRRLGASSVLEGSLRKWKDRVVITTRLIGVADGFDIWSEVYDGTSDDILAVQSQIAAAIVATLGPGPTANGPVIRGNTTSPEAHRAFLKGRHLCDRTGLKDLQRATQYFHTAIQLDGLYAAAHVGISDAHINMARLGHEPALRAMPAAEAAALRALAIEPRLAAAHKSLAVVLHRFYRDPQAAEEEFDRALELNPGYASARNALGEFLTLEGRYEQAIEVLELARDVDPVSTMGSSNLVLAYHMAGHHDRALDVAEEALTLDPQSPAVHCVLGLLLLQRDRPDEASRRLQHARQLDPADPETITALAGACRALRRTHEMDRLRQAMEELRDRSYSMPYHLAAIAAAIGDHEAALAGLEACAREQAFHLVKARVDPAFHDLRTSPRFQEVLLSRRSDTVPAPGTFRGQRAIRDQLRHHPMAGLPGTVE